MISTSVLSVPLLCVRETAKQHNNQNEYIPPVEALEINVNPHVGASQQTKWPKSPEKLFDDESMDELNKDYPFAPIPFLRELTSSNTVLRKNDILAFYGDSITFLNGYLTVLRRSIEGSVHTKGLNISVINRGYNGATIKDLISGGEAFGKAVMPYADALKEDNPTVVVIYIGINDIALKNPTHNWSDVREFTVLLKGMVETARVITKTERDVPAAVVLATVSVYGEEPMFRNFKDAELNSFAKAVYELSVELGTGLVDLRGTYYRYLNKYNLEDPKPYGVLTNDGIHPTHQGQVLIGDNMAQGITESLLYRF
eukprot:CFRG8216T1